ncbi:MAG TPA: monofunctional biosynthetic peptidoglycan transglycosylase [Kofleriaceae bacterium]|nr:monofunctional biosynthetic peptidoglycan transglycosylase [Kofleriaceae bacterium]
MSVARKQQALRILRWSGEGTLLLTAVVALAVWWSVPNVAALRNENPTTTAFIELRRSEAAALHRKFNLRWQWRSLPHISRYLRIAVVLAEDYRFYEHAGADWTAMYHAARANWAQGGMRAGGSTITQQLAKNLYLSPQRSLWRKVRELAIADQLEAELTKTRILELYLNVVEWGDGVFGAEAAAKFWFGHNAAALTPAQAARLAVALPNPKLRSPNRQFGNLNRKCARLVLRMHRMGVISAAEQAQALQDLGVAKAEVEANEAADAAAERKTPPPADPPSAPTPAQPTPTPTPTPAAEPAAPPAVQPENPPALPPAPTTTLTPSTVAPSTNPGSDQPSVVP